MKRSCLIGIVCLLAQALLADEAGTKEKITQAAKQLASLPNYSWTMTSREADGSPGRLGPIEGKADASGLTFLTFTISSIPVEVYLKGEKGAAKGLEGWQTLDEIAQTSGTAAAVVRFLRNYKAPAAEAAALPAKTKEIKEAAGVFSGELTEEATKDLLLRGARRREGQEPPKVADPKGAVKFWVQDGTLSKFEVNLQGKLSTSEREMEINRTATIEIKDIGKTKLEVPPEAKQKMN